MAAYVIYQAEVTNPEQYDRYRENVSLAISDAGGKYIVRGGEIDHLEGDPPLGRTVIGKFDSMDAARAFYFDERYREVKASRTLSPARRFLPASRKSLLQR